MPPLFFGTWLDVDLSSGQMEERELPDELFEELIGGAAMMSKLMADHNGECVSLGAGPLTGTPCPGASAAFAGIRRGDGSTAYSPVMLNAGLELKLTGFDFVLIHGRSEKPGYLWIRDGAADIVDGSSLPADDSWVVCSRIRSEQGDPRIQVISSSVGNCASLNYTGGWDNIGLGRAMNAMNLKGIAFRGMGEVELSEPEDFLSKASGQMVEEREKVGSKEGSNSLLPQESAARIRGVSRGMACFSCPYPCMSYAATDDPDYRQMLLMDQRSLAALTRLPGRDELIVKILMALHRRGMRFGDSVAKDTDSLDELVEKVAAIQTDEPDLEGLDTITEGTEPSAPVAAGYILGLCPRYIAAIGVDMDEYAELLSLGFGRSVTSDDIIRVAGRI